MSIKNKKLSIYSEHQFDYIFEKLNLWRNTEENLCDIIVNAGGKKFYAHKVILCSTSKHFESVVFENKLFENNKHIVNLSKVSADSFESILEFLYTYKLNLTDQTIEDILQTAKQLRIHKAIEACKNYMLNSVTIKNFQLIKKLAEVHNFHDVKLKVYEVLQQYIDEYTLTKEFFELDSTDLESILAISNSNRNEEKLCHSLFKWLEYKFDERKMTIHKLLKYINTENISKYFVETCLIKEDVARRDSILFPWIFDSFYVNNTITYLYILDRHLTYQFDINTIKLTQLQTYPHVIPIFHYGTATMYKNYIYYFTEHEGGHNYPIYSMSENRWSKSSIAKNLDILGSNVICLNDDLYFIGEKNFQIDLLSAIESTITIPENCRTNPGLATYKGGIFACGGWRSNIVEMYDPREGVWKNMPELTSIISSTSCTVTDDYLYCTSLSEPKTEKFHFKNNKWEEICESKSLDWKTLANFNGNIYSCHRHGISQYSNNVPKWSLLIDQAFKNPIILNA